MSRLQRVRLHCVLLVILALCGCTSTDTRGISEWLSHEPYAAVRTYRPPPPARYLVLLLSGDGGWGAPLSEIARRLSAQGALVAGVDVRDLFAVYSRDPHGCVSPGADLAALARYLQQRYALAGAPVVLIGHSAGATLAYVALVQSTPGTFAGALTLSFCADLDLEKPLCGGPGLRSAPRTGGVQLLPATSPLPAPWFALHGLDDQVCPAAEAREFVSVMPGTHFLDLPGISHSYHHMSCWWPMFETAWHQLTAP